MGYRTPLVQVVEAWEMHLISVQGWWYCDRVLQLRQPCWNPGHCQLRGRAWGLQAGDQRAEGSCGDEERPCRLGRTPCWSWWPGSLQWGFRIQEHQHLPVRLDRQDPRLSPAKDHLRRPVRHRANQHCPRCPSAGCSSSKRCLGTTSRVQLQQPGLRWPERDRQLCDQLPLAKDLLGCQLCSGWFHQVFLLLSSRIITTHKCQ